MNITKETIEQRVRDYQVEQAVLTQSHEAMVSTFNQRQQEFNSRVAQNQNRFQQIAGAIAELTQLRHSLEAVPVADNGDEPIALHRIKK